MSETRLWQQCKAALDRANLYSERLTDKLKGGLPDCFFVQQGITHWMELKEVEWCTSTISFRPDQIPTLYRLHRNGAPTWLLVRDERGKRVFLFGNINTGGRNKPLIPFGEWKRLADPAFLFHANEAQNPNLKCFDTAACAISYVLSRKDLYEF